MAAIVPGSLAQKTLSAGAGVIIDYTCPDREVLITTLSSMITSLERRIVCLQEERAPLCSQVVAQTAMVSDLTRKIVLAQRETEEALGRAEATIHELTENNARLASEIAALRARSAIAARAHEEKEAASAAQVATLADRVTALEETNAELSAKIAKLQDVILKIKAELDPGGRGRGFCDVLELMVCKCIGHTKWWSARTFANVMRGAYDDIAGKTLAECLAKEKA